uniref:Fibulin-1 n=1 Tax=Ascaris suum TaxID=6253 RepID=F1KUB1_ASCSU
MRRLLGISIFLFLSIVYSWSSELTRCCNSGARHFRKTATCSSIATESAAVTCTRSASICCLRALLDQSCDHGTNMAENEEYCPANLNQVGGGIRKECCDCCLLAKDLIRRNAECIAPLGFSAQCLRSFNKCCHRKTEISFPEPLLMTNRPESLHFLGVGDRCASAKCEHLCSDRGGETVECSCRAGYDLGPDGTSCVDRDECATSYDGPTMVLTTPCEENETCENLPGGYRCYVRDPAVLSDGTSPFHVIEESSLYKRGPENMVRERYEQSCPIGWTLDEMGACVDIDECLLLVDDCLESQRCLNTPGSFKCIRTISCGTGYVIDSENTEECIDVDECTRGLHDCGPLYVCRNTQGSYRCDPKKCAEGELMNPRTGECTHVDCPIGFKPENGRCEDVNECETVGRCRQFEECINTPGSYRCQEKGNLCTNGYRMDRDTGFCVDINECVEGTHQCEDKQCINLLGSYKCRCSAGYEFNETTMRCEDIDECNKFAGHVCSLHATCENTIGSFECHCKDGFKLASDARNCDDIDECELGIAKCAQKCINIPGSYQCICERGYQLGADGITCEDIDECSLWAGSGDDLCMGGCINTPGSYMCNCPPGYEIQKDAKTCKDIDECERGECQGTDRICVNTLGSFKCHHIECPPNYIHDKHYKNRCNRPRHLCDPLTEVQCKAYPVHVSWQYIAIPRHVPISSQRTSITLFTIKGPSNPNSVVQFELNLKSAETEGIDVLPAVRSNFLLQKGDERNSAIISLRDSLDGPQDIVLELVLRLTVNGVFQGKFIANLIVYVSAMKRQRNLPLTVLS